MGFYNKDDESMRILLQESDYAFSIMVNEGGTTNTDFADFTSNNFIRSFRHIMQKPDLSRAQLASMLRTAEKRKNRRDNDVNWSDFMAKTVKNSSNSNTQTVQISLSSSCAFDFGDFGGGAQGGDDIVQMACVRDINVNIHVPKIGRSVCDFEVGYIAPIAGHYIRKRAKRAGFV